MAVQFYRDAGPYHGRHVNYGGFDFNPDGIARCAIGPELRHAVSAVTTRALEAAKMFSPGDEAGSYDRGFRSGVEIIPDWPNRQRGDPPMERWGGHVQNVSSLAILVEVGSSTYPAHRVLGQTLEWLELVAAS